MIRSHRSQICVLIVVLTSVAGVGPIGQQQQWEH
jgi:hypothetical protein